MGERRSGRRMVCASVRGSFADQLRAMLELLKAKAGKTVRFIRPPGGEDTLKKNLARGHVGPTQGLGCSSSDPTWDPAKEQCTVLDVTFQELEAQWQAAGLITYLGAGTSGANSWLVELSAQWYKEAERDTEKLIARARRTGSIEKIVVLGHDNGGASRAFTLANLQRYIDFVKVAASAKKGGSAIAVDFVPMSELVLPCFATASKSKSPR